MSNPQSIQKKKRGGYRASMIRYPLAKVEKREDGWYAIYADSSEYRHSTEQECRQLHRWDGHDTKED